MCSLVQMQKRPLTVFETLKHAGLGSNMLNWITSVYTGPSACVRANGVTSDPFPIANGTEQGCPLSHLLFCPVLGTLCHVRLNPDIYGIGVGPSQQKVSAYADDMMFLLTNSIISLPNLLRKFETYGALSNLKIHF